MRARRRHAVSVRGPADARTIVFVHGFGCDQAMWEAVASRFEDHRTVLLDLVGFGSSDLGFYDPQRYSALDGHADDIVELLIELDVGPVVLVGHSVSAMIAVLVATRTPELVERLVLVGPSPRYVRDDGYEGGFSADDIEEMLEAIDTDFIAWSMTMAPVIAGVPEAPQHGEHLARSFCRSDPEAARQLARVTFLGDNRTDLPHVAVPTLVMQCAEDPIAPVAVGRHVADAIPGAELVQLEARGHCPNLTAPEETADVLRQWLR